jgi:PAS domain S-box-containing protein
MIRRALKFMIAPFPASDVVPIEEENAFRFFFLANPLPIWVCDQATLRILAVNDAALDHYGWEREEFLQMSIEDLRPPGDTETLWQYRKTPELNETLRLRHRRKSGEIFEVESTWMEIPFRGRRAVYVIALDCGAKEFAEQRAKEKAALVELASDAIVVHDMNQQVLSWNLGAEKIYGWTEKEACGARIDELFSVDRSAFDDAFVALLENGEWSGELKHRRKDGQDVFVSSRWNLVRDAAGKPKSVLVINTNITDARQLEKQFLRAQRLESIGTLASGIAHDLNNILSPILMSAGLLRRRHTHDAETLRMVGIIESSAERGAGIVKQVLTFARGAEGQRVAIQPKHLLNELSKIVAQTFPRSIDTQTNFHRDLWLIIGDPTQIHQVLLNLCVNARDAIMTMKALPNEPEPQRILTIAADNVNVDQHFASMNPGAQLGPHVVFQVSDTGTGISAEVIDKIFDPFFTTKEPGKGTGLGLATVMGIVKSHGGFLTVQSENGKGTTFLIYFPAVLDGVEATEPPQPEKPIATGRGELILVVDDEPPIREAMVSTLQSNGYHCYTAEDGSDALALYFSRRKDIDLVLTDLSMGQMDGVKLIRNLRRVNPHVRVIVSSGHVQKDTARELHSLGVRHILEKPYNAEKLLRTLRSAIDQRV